MKLLASAAIAALLTLAALTSQAHAVAIDVRTFRVSTIPHTDSNGPSANPAVSAGGRYLAFDTAGTHIPGSERNGAVRDVVFVDGQAVQFFLVSLTPDGSPSDGDSFDPALSGAGERVVFTSKATNLVPGDTNGFDDIFYSDPDQNVRLLTRGPNGEPANGPSSSADISTDGRFVVFVSAASNLVPNDTNQRLDIFLADLLRGSIRRVSTAVNGAEGQGDARAPSISGSGRYVTFESSAPNLVVGDTNGTRDVFLVDTVSNRLQRVSVNSRERQQNQSVNPAFLQTSDVSNNGKYIVFESDATNLVSQDTNRDTDVFLRDLNRGVTTRVSVGRDGVQGDNDSFSPSITPSGRHIAFESFAENLAPGDATGEDVFVHDRLLAATVTANVTATGAPRGKETVPQLLQRPALSADAHVVAFSSTADNMVANDRGGQQDVFIRAMNAPAARFSRAPRSIERTNRPAYGIRVDDKRATAPLCTLDNRQVACRNRGRLRAGAGRHVFRIRAGGPGMLYQDVPLEKRFRVAR